MSFAPTDIAGLTAWYDSDDASTFTYSSGVVVSQWDDKSGNLKHLTQGTVGFQPSRSGTQNNKNTVVFDGTDDFISSASGNPNQPNTVFVVAQFTNVDTNDHVLFNTGAGGPQIQTNGGTWQAYAGGSLDSGVADDALWNVHCVNFNGASSFMYLNGTQIATGNTLGNNGASIRLGSYSSGVSYWAGAMAEVIVYDTTLSASDRQSATDYLLAKWLVSASIISPMSRIRSRRTSW